MFQAKDPQGVLRPFSFRSYAKPPAGKDGACPSHLWYSKKQAKVTDTIAVYRLFDFNVEVDVTAASSTNDHGTNWDDLVYLGVGWYVKTKTNPLMLNLSHRITNPCLEVNRNGNSYRSERMLQLVDEELHKLSTTSEPGIIHIDSHSPPPLIIEHRPPGIEPPVTHSYTRRQTDFNLNAYGNSYQQVRRDLGDTGGHSGVDAPDPLELVSHPDNPTFIDIPNTFRIGTIPLEGTPIGSGYGVNRGGDGQGWPSYKTQPLLGHNPDIFDEPTPDPHP